MKAAIREPKFTNRLNDLLEAEKVRGCTIFDSRYSDWDERRGWTVYYGLYYHLRDICEEYGLFWQKDAVYVARLLSMLRIDQSLSNAINYALASDDCPSQLHWQWFRMAQIGLAIPRPHERSNNERSSTRGLTLIDIAEHHAKDEDGVDERTVLRAVGQCWKYLERGGVNIGQIADLAGLTADEGLWFFFSLHMLIEERRSKRERKSRKQEPDT